MSHHWTPLKSLQDPFNDAINYRTRAQKEFFNKIFLRTDDLTKCLEPAIYFLMGEKGSGKTAYATFLENNEIDKHRCKVSTMTESQYKRFIAMKQDGKLAYSDYANIWRPILLNMMSQALVQKSKGFIAGLSGKFDVIEKEIGKFNTDALNPEVEVAFEMVKQASASAAVGKPEVLGAKAEVSGKLTDKTELIKHHLLNVEGRLKQAIADLKLSYHHVLFIDGIDYRPESVPYGDYLNCLKGLGEAVWQLNTEFFANIRDSKGRLKIVLLVRPDVFHQLNLYNSNSRLQDNCLFLGWSTTEQGLRDSKLYEAVGKYFASQQKSKTDSVPAADHYLAAQHGDYIFKRLLRSCFQKPRDLLTFVKLARNTSVNRLGRGDADAFDPEIVRNPDFTREYSDYLLGEVRNHSAFYMQREDFALYLKFFQYLDGKSEFSFDEFCDAFRRFKNWISGERLVATEYVRDPEALLQLFYDINLVGYLESVGTDEEKQFVHYAFRERSLNNLAPKIKTTGHLRVGPGIAKALDIGLRSKNSAPSQTPDRRRAPDRRKRPRRR